jgi:hypothetical protein
MAVVFVEVAGGVAVVDDSSVQEITEERSLEVAVVVKARRLLEVLQDRAVPV